MTAASNVSILANIQIFRGTDVTIEVGPVTDVDGNTIDWTGYTINMALTTQAGAGTQAITKSTAGGITISTTVFTIVMSDTDTAMGLYARAELGCEWYLSRDSESTSYGTPVLAIDEIEFSPLLVSTALLNGRVHAGLVGFFADLEIERRKVSPSNERRRRTTGCN